MLENKPEKHKEKRHHFLFYIFKEDKEANKMPKDRLDNLFVYLKSVFTDNKNGKKERK